MYGTDFWISTRCQLRNRTKLKIIDFSKTARWISMKIKLRGHFLILFQLRLSKARKTKFQKIDFLKIVPICTCQVEKNRQIFTPDFGDFYNWRWKYDKNWVLSSIFSEFLQSDNFQLCTIPQLTMWGNLKIGPVHFFLYSFLRWLEKPHEDIWKG